MEAFVLISLFCFTFCVCLNAIDSWFRYSEKECMWGQLLCLLLFFDYVVVVDFILLLLFTCSVFSCCCCCCCFLVLIALPKFDRQTFPSELHVFFFSSSLLVASLVNYPQLLCFSFYFSFFLFHFSLLFSIYCTYSIHLHIVLSCNLSERVSAC